MGLYIHTYIYFRNYERDRSTEGSTAVATDVVQLAQYHNVHKYIYRPR